MDIKKFVRDIFTNLIANLLILAGGILVIILAFFQRLPLYQLLLLIIGTVGLVLWTINQIAVWKERHKKSLTKLSDKELENTIREWINIPAWSVQPQTLQEGTLFAYLIQHQDLHVAIVRQASERSIIGLASKLTMRSKKTELSQPEWERLSGQLSIQLAQFGIEYDFVGDPIKWETIQIVEPVILDDSMTGFYFRSRVMFVIRAAILTLEIWKEALRLSQKSIPDKEGFQTE